MSVDRIDSLTESQRSYLRLVLQHKSSKEIAQSFGISAHTVDKRLKEAMRILRVNSRVDAARILAATEGFGYPSELGPQSPDLGIPAAAATVAAPAIRHDERRAPAEATAIEEDRILFRAYPIPRGFPLPVPTPERPRNDLTLWQRLGWTVGLIIGLAIATGMMLSGLSALSSVALALAR